MRGHSSATPSPSKRPLNNLPVALTSFVGRRVELEEFGRLLRTTRLLTLTGPGGSGKTRLALELAVREVRGDRDDREQGTGTREQARTGPTQSLSEPSVLSPQPFDGVCLVELGALGNPALVPQVVAARLGVREVAGRPPIEMLFEALGTQRLLLLFDNCEHLIAACAELIETLLQRCPAVHVLATSREPLDVAGEVVRRVPALSLPTIGNREQGTGDRGQGASGDLGGHAGPTVAGYAVGADQRVRPGASPSQSSVLSPQSSFESYGEAVQLFLERAQLQVPGFTLRQANAATVAQICVRLDGLPLAIELAASWVSVLPVEQIADWLEDRFHLLVGGSRTATARHQTLRAAVDWSYNLLSGEERRLFDRLSVFPGGFSLEAAEAVRDRGQGTGNREDARSSLSPRSSALAVLRALVGKSLVVAETEGPEARYRLLETLREYGRERLRESGDWEAAQDQHAGYYAALAESAAHALFGREQEAWLARLEREHDNLRTAQRWFAARGDRERELRLVSGLWRFWYLRGHLREGASSLEAALRRRGTASRPAMARALNGAGILRWFLGEIQRSADLHEEALGLCRSGEDQRELALCLNMLGLVARTRGDLARAEPLCLEAREISEELSDAWGTAFSLYLLGEIAYFRGEQREGERLWLRGLLIFRECGDLWGIGYTLINLGNASRFFGDLNRAIEQFEEGLAVCRRMGDPWGIAYSLASLGEVMRDRGEYAEAAALCEESLTLRRELGDQIGIARSLDGLANLALRTGDLERAGRLLRQSLLAYQRLEYQRGVARCLAGFAELVASSMPERALRLDTAAVTLRAAISVALSAADQVLFERRLLALQNRLDPAAFSTALRDGEAMELEAAIAYALSIMDEGAATEPGDEGRQREESRSVAAEGITASHTPVLPVASPQSPVLDQGLTLREADVLALIAAGCSNKEIARRLVVSLRTVEHHITSIYSKIGAHGKADATAYFLARQPEDST